MHRLDQLARHCFPARAYYAGFGHTLSSQPCAGPDINVFVASGAAAAISALKYGPLAFRKIQAMAGFEPDGGMTFPPEKSVKIVFHEKDQEGTNKTVKWRPSREYLHDVFVKAGMSIADFEISYEQGEEVFHLDATKPGIEEFLAEHAQHPDPRLKVEWRRPGNWEQLQSKLSSAMSWLTGQGGATDKAVLDAQQKVEQSGGKIVVSDSCRRSFVNRKGYLVTHWAEAVEGLKQELQLTDAQTAPLKCATISEEGKGVHFIGNRNAGKGVTTTYLAYHTVMHGDKIDVIYGIHEESMEASGVAASLPSQNCIQYDGRSFSVWPPALPHSKQVGRDMHGLVVDIPSGWRVVDCSKADFPNLAKSVVAPYGWHTVRMVAGGPEGKLQGWYTATAGSDAGKCWSTDVQEYVEKIDQSRYRFKTDDSFRLLIEALPAASPELENNWKRFVKLSAQREWCQHLGMPLVGALSA
ncbi:unnamed protein product [Symbiodinium sp. CCMP2592]|nr:unnamed protein product [Symbiodinium sp. CCMP2592]